MVEATQRRFMQLAAGRALSKVRADRERAPEPACQMLAYLESHLFDPGLDATRLRLACGLGDHSSSTRFREAVGLPPKAYIQERRLEAASRLLTETDLSVFDVARLVGYVSSGVFRRAFLRWSGQHPSALRKANRGSRQATAGNDDKVRPTSGAINAKQIVGQPDDSRLARALCGQLASPEAEHLVLELLRVWQRPGAGPSSLTSSTAPEQLAPRNTAMQPGLEAFEQSRAENAWQELRRRPSEERRQWVRQRLVFRTPALFRLLCRQSTKVGRSHRNLAVPLAELAVESLQGLDRRAVSDRELTALEVEGWVRVSHARRLAFDFPGAERALGKASSAFQRFPKDRTAQIRILNARASLRRYQRRGLEALTSANEALVLLSPEEQPVATAQTLVLRAALYSELGEPARGLHDLHQAWQLAQGRDRHVELAARQNLAAAWARMGHLDELQQLLPASQRLSAELGETEASLQLSWIEGFVARRSGEWARANSCLEQVRDGLVDLGLRGDAALVNLELALVCLKLGTFSKAARLASEALRLFDGLQLPQEALASMRTLREALAADRLSAHTLLRSHRTLRQHLPAGTLAPSVQA